MGISNIFKMGDKLECPKVVRTGCGFGIDVKIYFPMDGIGAGCGHGVPSYYGKVAFKIITLSLYGNYYK